MYAAQAQNRSQQLEKFAETEAFDSSCQHGLADGEQGEDATL